MKRPPRWFKWAVWSGIALAVLAPTACVLSHGEVPGYPEFPSLPH